MADYYVKKGKFMPYGMTYQKAVRALNELGTKLGRSVKITDVFVPRKNVEITEENIKKSRGKFPIKGVGKGVAQKILQFQKSGSVEEYKLAKKDKLLDKKIKQGKVAAPTTTSKAVSALSKVSYIGEATAKKLVKDYGFKNVSELSKAVKIGYFDSGSYITKSPNGKTLKFTKNQKKMIDYHSRLKRIPRAFTKALEETTKHLLDKNFGENSYQLAFGGSYRRGAKDSGDIDILIKSDVFTLKEFVKLLKKWGVVFDTLSEGKDDFKGLGRCPGMKKFIFRIDIMFTKPENWNAALMHFTGNDVLNRLMREKAKELREYDGKKYPYGAILSQKGLFIRGANNKSSGKRVIPGGLKSEKQLFDILWNLQRQITTTNYNDKLQRQITKI
jgi:DNA polymerase/3'-5' exonuclease PolX